jgi:2-C-methyl-D-erythritol 2,4-cyclodiphosphate synthase
MTTSGDSAGSRVGWGFDAHALNDHPPVILGGVVVSDIVGVEATSDGDVLAHAVADALLGACVLGDIGHHFPSDDPSLAGADSMVFVRQAATMAVAAGWQPTHVDVTVVAQSVIVSPHRSQIAVNLAETLGLEVSSVSVKATSTDGLGFIGKDRGIAAVAVVTVVALP